MLKIPESVKAWGGMDSMERVRLMGQKTPEERMRFYMKLNIFYLMERESINTQKEFCERLDIPQSAFSKLLREQQQPSLAFLIRLKEVFHCDIDSFLTLDMKAAAAENSVCPAGNLTPFQGLYYMYYSPDGRKLKCGLVLLKKGTGAEKNNLEAIAVSGLSRPEADILYRDAAEKTGYGATLTNTWNYLETLKMTYRIYRGRASFSGNHILVNMSRKGHDGFVSMMFHKPPGGRKYMGGSGICISIAGDVKRSLCYQRILISGVPVRDEESGICRQLALKKSRISPEQKMAEGVKSLVGEAAETYAGKDCGFLLDEDIAFMADNMVREMFQAAEQRMMTDINEFTDMIIRRCGGDAMEPTARKDRLFLIKGKARGIFRDILNPVEFQDVIAVEDDEKGYKYLLEHCR